MYSWQWNIIWQYKSAFLSGALTTIEMTAAVIVLGTLLGTLIACAKASPVLLVRWLTEAYIHAARALPVLVVLIWIYYVLPLMTDIRMGPFMAGTVALSLHLGAFVAETLRAGVQAIPRSQHESGLALGMTPLQVMAVIVLPQAIRSITPNLLGLYITEMKNTSLASIIAVNELMHRGNTLISASSRPLEIYTTVAVLYVLMILPLIALAHRLERAFSRGTNVIPLFI